MSRIRYKLEEFDTIPKLLIASNPSKNFLYQEFYKPSKKNELKPFRKFVIALVQDNPFISPHYIENLKKLDKISKERLLYGNFEYDDDPAKMIEYDKILDIFTNKFVRKEEDERYMTVDPARFGRDNAVIMTWKGLYMEKMFVYGKCSMPYLEGEVVRIAEQEEIPRSNIAVDEDGIGGSVVDHVPGVRGFINNSKPIYEGGGQPINYKNLKAECYFKLATYINQGKIGANFENDTWKEMLIEELEQVKRKDIDKDGKLAIVGKDEVKENIGRSPDFSDCCMQRMLFELNKGEWKMMIDKDNVMGLA